MTGFGRAERKSRFGKIILELSSVNNRFLEFSFRLPRPFHVLEARIRDHVGAQLCRGKVTVSLNLEGNGEIGRYTINEAAARDYVKQLRRLGKELKLEGEPSIADLVQLPDVARPEREDLSSEQAWEEVEPLLKKALAAMQAMRHKEGQSLKADMVTRLKNMEARTRLIEKKTVGSVAAYADKLRKRIGEIIDAGPYDNGRLEQEIAFYADRTDIAEECTRFKSHISQYRAIVNQKNEAVGRRLNFLLQELNREVNTIGSKCADFDISSEVIALKEEIERLREQVQNVE